MRSASFRCIQRHKDGDLILHYYSQRKGMEYMVIGLVKAVARRLPSELLSIYSVKDFNYFKPTLK